MKRSLAVVVLVAAFAPGSIEADTPLVPRPVVSAVATPEETPVSVQRIRIEKEKRKRCNRRIVVPAVLWDFTNTSKLPLQEIRFAIETIDPLGAPETITAEVTGSFSPSVTIKRRGDVIDRPQSDGTPRPVRSVRVIQATWTDGTVWTTSDRVLQKLALAKPVEAEREPCH